MDLFAPRRLLPTLLIVLALFAGPKLREIGTIARDVARVNFWAFIALMTATVVAVAAITHQPHG